MKEQIIINGVLMDHTSGKSLSLVYQSPFFTDIDNIVSNRTNSIDFPATKNNLSAIDRVHLSGSDSKFAYRKHKAIYLRDGVQVFSGYGTLMSVTPTAIKFTFTWGNVSAFQSLLDTNLRDLHSINGGEISIPWTDSFIASSSYYPANVDTGGVKHPCLSMDLIMQSIEATTGITIEGKERFSEYRIPITCKRANDAAKVAQCTYSAKVFRKGSKPLCYDYAEASSDIKGMYLGNGLFDVEEYETLKIVVTSSFSYSTTAAGGKNQQIYIFAVDEDGNHAKHLASVPLTVKESGARYIYSLGDFVPDKEIVLNVKDYTHIMIQTRQIMGNVDSATTFISGQIRLLPDFDKEEELVFGGSYPLFYNMPDWTVSQLLKNLMKMEGLFAVCPNEKTIRLLSIDDLYANRVKSLDLTDSLILSNGRPNEKTFTYQSYAQRNNFKYAEDETVKTIADGVIEVESENLSKETDLVSLDFAPSDDFGGKVKLPLYTTDEDGTTSYSDITPRILKLSPKSASGSKEVLTFQGLEWSSLIEENYASFKRVIASPKVIKASVKLSTLDLVNLDLSVPVYSYALGHHYAIVSLTTKDKGIAELELLQLAVNPNENTNPAVDISDINLAVVKDSDGNWVASITNKPLSTINAIRADKNFKVCLLRYGYARRGKYIEYNDSLGIKTNTKTSRRAKYSKEIGGPGYKQVRTERGGGTPCWRIIGDEILRTGYLGQMSQTRKYYDDCTLVFRLLDPIVLPPMRAKMRCKKSNRIHNKAKNGIAELSIGLFLNDGYGNWKLVSNRCPIRSRINNNTQYWEFNSVNVIE